jgi:hypothetical protein
MCAKVIPYTTDAQANAATKNPQLKLIFRLVHCHVRDEGELRVLLFKMEGLKRLDSLPAGNCVPSVSLLRA